MQQYLREVMLHTSPLKLRGVSTRQKQLTKTKKKKNSDRLVGTIKKNHSN